MVVSMRFSTEEVIFQKKSLYVLFFENTKIGFTFDTRTKMNSLCRLGVSFKVNIYLLFKNMENGRSQTYCSKNTSRTTTDKLLWPKCSIIIEFGRNVRVTHIYSGWLILNGRHCTLATNTKLNNLKNRHTLIFKEWNKRVHMSLK